MPIYDLASPSPSNMPPPNLKRPRQSNPIMSTASNASPSTTLPPRAKRRKPETSGVETDGMMMVVEKERGGRYTNSVGGNGKHREEEVGESMDVIQTKVRDIICYMIGFIPDL